MKQNPALAVTLVLSVVLTSLHITDDIVRKFEPGKGETYIIVFMMAILLYATLVLADRRSGLVIILLGSLGAAYVPSLHMQGAGLVGGRIAGSSGIFLWVWTLIALAVCGVVSAGLALTALWRLQWGRDRQRPV